MNKETKSKYSYAPALLGQNQKESAIADLGTTGHFLEVDSKCVDKQIKNEEVEVSLPDGSFVWSTHLALLDIPRLPIEVRREHAFPGIMHALISISMLCDQYYIAIFDAEMVYIVQNGIVIMHGYGYPVTKLYMVHLNQRQTDPQPKLNIEHMTNLEAVSEVTNNAYEIRSKQKLVEFYHKCCFSLVVCTWIEAINKGFFCTGKSIATAK